MTVKHVLVVLLLGLSVFATNAATKEHTPFPGFKKVWIYGNTVNPASVVIILSGDGGWLLGVVDLAKHLARQNALVIGVSSMPFMKHMEKQDSACYNMADDMVALSHFIQSKYHLTYKKPVILGYSLGATLAYGIIAQAPAGTFKGAISLGFCYDLELAKPLCKGAGLEFSKRAKKGYDLLPASHLKDPFIIIQGADDRMCKFCLAKDFAVRTIHAEIWELPSIRHGSLGLRKWMPNILDAYGKVSGAGEGE